MPAADPPTSAAAGAVIVVGTPAHVGPIVAAVQAMGLPTSEADDPYAAMAELCRWPGRYRSVILSLQGMYREELQFITAAKRWGNGAVGTAVEVWLADIDGRPSALAEAMRLGADALLVDDGLHRFGTPPKAAVLAPEVRSGPAAHGLHTAEAQPAPLAEPASSRAASGDLAGSGTTDLLDGHGDDPGLSAWHQIAGGGGNRSPGRAAGEATSDGARRAAAPAAAVMTDEPDEDDFDPLPGEPVLTAEELRALLQDEPDGPP